MHAEASKVEDTQQHLCVCRVFVAQQAIIVMPLAVATALVLQEVSGLQYASGKSLLLALGCYKPVSADLDAFGAASY